MKLNILGKEDKSLFDSVLKNGITNYGLASHVVPELLKLGILEKDELKKAYLDYLDAVLKKVQTDYDWAAYVLPKFLSLGILEKEELQHALSTEKLNSRESPNYRFFEILSL